MKVGDELKFKKIKWVLTERKVYQQTGVVWWKYKVYRKYGFIWLNNTDCTYFIFPHRWLNLKSRLEKDKSFYYTQLKWCNG